MVNIKNFHPTPQTKPLTVKESLFGINSKTLIKKDYSGQSLKGIALIDLFKLIKPGETAAKYLNGIGFSLARLRNDRPANTIMKSIPYSGISVLHPNENRQLSIEEVKRIASFPDDFECIGSFREKWARIGNSVPPMLMKHIAEHIKTFDLFNDKPTCISLFAGCGGSSLGYKWAGYKELLAVEFDNNAVETFKLNFSDVKVYHGDINKLTVEECMELTNLKKGELDLLDGSPPCQGFSTAGKRKMLDPRNTLFEEYARLLEGLQPKVFVMENVTGLVKGAMKQIYLKMIKRLRDCGYIAKGKVMNAMYFGVPQSRERVIIIGVRKDLA